MSLTEHISDDTLYSLTPTECRVLRRAADDGWYDRPGYATVDAVERKTGIVIQSEDVRGEGRYFWIERPHDVPVARELVARLDALPRRARRKGESQ